MQKVYKQVKEDQGELQRAGPNPSDELIQQSIENKKVLNSLLDRVLQSEESKLERAEGVYIEKFKIPLRESTTQTDEITKEEKGV